MILERRDNEKNPIPAMAQPTEHPVNPIFVTGAWRVRHNMRHTYQPTSLAPVIYLSPIAFLSQ
jgi:hypothetical protein